MRCICGTHAVLSSINLLETCVVWYVNVHALTQKMEDGNAARHIRVVGRTGRTPTEVRVLC
jgi:hypothetical protein